MIVVGATLLAAATVVQVSLLSLAHRPGESAATVEAIFGTVVAALASPMMFPALVGLLLVMTGYAASWLWLCRTGCAEPHLTTLVALAIAALPCLVIAVIAGLVGLSVPDPLGHRWLGLDTQTVAIVASIAIEITLCAPLGALVWWLSERALRSLRPRSQR